jgi:hypothetical protein
LLVSKSGTIEDLIQALIKKARLADEVEGGRIRVFEANGHKYSRELSRDYSVISMSDYTSFYAERVPEEELSIDENNFISVFHFQNEPSRVHGVPFKFLLIEVRGLDVTGPKWPEHFADKSRRRARNSRRQRSASRSARASRGRASKRSSLRLFAGLSTRSPPT